MLRKSVSLDSRNLRLKYDDFQSLKIFHQETIYDSKLPFLKIETMKKFYRNISNFSRNDSIWLSCDKDLPDKYQTSVISTVSKFPVRIKQATNPEISMTTSQITNTNIRTRKTRHPKQQRRPIAFRLKNDPPPSFQIIFARCSTTGEEIIPGPEREPVRARSFLPLPGLGNCFAI